MRHIHITERKLKLRILAHLFAGSDRAEIVASVWHGYLAGLLEWDLLDITTYDSLRKILPVAGNLEAAEIMRGFDGDTE